MTVTAKLGTSEMTEEIHFAELHKIFTMVRRYAPDRYLLDIKDMRFDPDPASKEFAANLFKDNSSSYIAIVSNPTSDPSQEIIRGAFDGFQEVANNKFTLRHYHDRQAAEEWLRTL